MADTISIGPGPNLRAGEVALWERDERHPDGEVYLADGDEPTQAARTGAVQTRLIDGRLIEASHPSPSTNQPIQATPAKK